MTRLKWAAIVVVVLFAAAQLVRPEHANPPTDASRTIQAQLGTGAPASKFAAVLDRACNDCHSNRTVWPRFAEVAPLSWLMAYTVKTGRQAVDFSEWATYPPDRQQKLLVAACQDARSGKMPGGIWTGLRPKARLSTEDIEAICAVSRQAEAHAAAVSP